MDWKYLLYCANRDFHFSTDGVRKRYAMAYRIARLERRSGIHLERSHDAALMRKAHQSHVHRRFHVDGYFWNEELHVWEARKCFDG